MRNHQCRYPCCRWSSLLDACCYSGITCASMLCIPGIFRPTATKFSVHWRHHRAHRRLSVCLPFCAVDCCDHMVTSNFTWKNLVTCECKTWKNRNVLYKEVELDKLYISFSTSDTILFVQHKRNVAEARISSCRDLTDRAFGDFTAKPEVSRMGTRVKTFFRQRPMSKICWNQWKNAGLITDGCINVEF